jgi:hypothetical protein
MTSSFPLDQQVEHVTVTALRLGCHCRVELPVDAGEELGKAPRTGAGREDALLVVPELVQHELDVALALVLVDLGKQLGLSPLTCD